MVQVQILEAHHTIHVGDLIEYFPHIQTAFVHLQYRPAEATHFFKRVSRMSEARDATQCIARRSIDNSRSNNLRVMTLLSQYRIRSRSIST